MVEIVRVDEYVKYVALELVGNSVIAPVGIPLYELATEFVFVEDADAVDAVDAVFEEDWAATKASKPKLTTLFENMMFDGEMEL